MSADPKTVLLTGAPGFLGSHLAEDLTARDYKVIAIVRNGSDLWRCKEFDKRLIYVNIDSGDFKGTLKKYKPSILIHSAWKGVSGKERNDIDVQRQNALFAEQILRMAVELSIKKAVCFGSQAEYGNFNGRINEEALCVPVTAYGRVKLEVLKSFQDICESNSIKWYWLRLFSVYGAREGDSWFIPSLVRNLLSEKSMDLTGCEQRYDYMYVKDFTRAVICVLESEGSSGVFNLSSNASLPLKNIVGGLRSSINPNVILNLGALPYSPGQVMHMEGDSEKFYRQFNFKVNSDFNTNISEVVDYYRNKLKEKPPIN